MTGRAKWYSPAGSALLLVFTFVSGSARAAPGEASAWPPTSPLGRDLPTPREAPVGTPAGEGPVEVAADEQLTLRRSLELAARFSPALAAAVEDMRAAESRARQAGTRPNPAIELETEEFGGTDARQGFDAAETTVSLSQPIELGGKRTKRQAVGHSEARIAGWEYEGARIAVLTRTKQAFVDVLTAQGRLRLAETSLALAEDVRKAAADRVRAGKVPEIEETKAAVAVTSAGIARDRAQRDLDIARRMLVAGWGGAVPRFGTAVGSLDSVREPPPIDALAAGLTSTPEVARRMEEVTGHRQSLELARSQRIPDITLNAGVRRFEEDGTHAAVAGIAMPLPLFDRNTGGILAAQHAARGAEQRLRGAHLEATTALADVHGRIESARTEALAVANSLLPAARGAFVAAQTGYRQGKFGLLEVLDAQRTLNDAESRRLDALSAYHKTSADLERLTGIPFETIVP